MRAHLVSCSIDGADHMLGEYGDVTDSTLVHWYMHWRWLSELGARVGFTGSVWT